MIPTSYKAKLLAFNDTKKYDLESFFMQQLIAARPNERVLDYGCGLGRMVWRLRLQDVDCYGFDVMNYREHDNPIVFRDAHHVPFDKIFFMHSWAHIPRPESLFDNVFTNLLKGGGQVTILTPNADWLEYMRDDTYVPDPTVVRHWTQAELVNAFGAHGYTVERQGQFGATCTGRVCERVFLTARKP